MRRQLRITTLQSLWEDRKIEASGEDAWEARLQELAVREGVNISDEGDEDGAAKQETSGNRPKTKQRDTYESIVKEFGVDYVSAKLRDEMADMQARATAMLDLRDEEERLAELEKREKKQKKRAAREERVRLRRDTRPMDKPTMSEHPAQEHKDTRQPKVAEKTSHGLSKDDWANGILT